MLLSCKGPGPDKTSGQGKVLCTKRILDATPPQLLSVKFALLPLRSAICIGTFIPTLVSSRNPHTAAHRLCSRCVFRRVRVTLVAKMYRRTLLYLCGGGRSMPGSSKYADQVLRKFTLGSVLRCDKSSPDDGATKPPGESDDKISVLVKEETSVPPKKDNLLDLISGMKVEVSSKRKFQAIKDKRIKQQNIAERQPIESASKMFQMVAEEIQPSDETPVSPELEAAASAVASAFPSQKNQVESELLRQLRIHKQMAEAQRKVEPHISTVLSGMKIVKNRPQTSRQDKMPAFISEDPTRSRLNIGRRLMIFPVPAVTEKPAEAELSPNLWDLELAKDIAYMCEQPPRNGFEEMIQWTKEGKLWTFPIDNEVGLDEEQKVEFYEHIFLDKYLEDFPKQGPIRHFMELVICGLSKNPYLTVQQKKDHIYWYRDYFHQKEDLLRECEVSLN
ncbi:small ribosomal subunit protein mS31 [Pseudophryne corroboree]|uniref:small ribosomal subunit protein mS31 n=1 Tax=Pseudophryne corroboree TaxID=495146 RepID=UPI003081A71C